MDTSMMFPKIDSILDMIKGSAEADSFRTLDYGWDYDDFLNSYIESPDPAYQAKYGLKPYFTTRHDQTVAQLQNTNVIPIISNVHQFPLAIHQNDSIFITALIEDETLPASTLLNYNINNGSLNNVNMVDDGLHHDGLPADGIYGGVIVAQNILDTIHYYITATDLSLQTGREPRIGDDLIIVEPIPHLVFNELMASNSTTTIDEYGEHNDWLEIYNVDSLPAFLGNKYLSDESNNPDKWRLPEVWLPGESWALIWCDEQGSQGPFHASFKLSAAGETVKLYEGTGAQYNFLDSITWTTLATDISIGCYPDGVQPIIQLEAPTPGYSNLNIGVPPVNGDISALVTPNPFSNHITILIHLDSSSQTTIRFMNLLGEEIFSVKENFGSGDNVLELSDQVLVNLSSGIYFLHLSATNDESNFSFTKKLVKN